MTRQNTKLYQLEQYIPKETKELRKKIQELLWRLPQIEQDLEQT